MKVKSFIIYLLLLVFVSGCSSFGRKLKSMLGGKSGKKSAVARTAPTEKRGPVSFSQRPDLKFNTQRKYRRMTKKRLEDQAKVRDRSGSLWLNDGQNGYLFSQNQARNIGDLLNVRLMGAAKEQLNNKTKIIKRLLRKMELANSLRRRIAAKKRARERRRKGAAEKEKAAEREPAGQKNEKEDNSPLKVKEVPTRIVEKLPDGNYRIKGGESFMIGSREYKVIVTGIVRNEDYNEDGINSSEILDPRYDIVGQRRSVRR